MNMTEKVKEEEKENERRKERNSKKRKRNRGRQDYRMLSSNAAVNCVTSLGSRRKRGL